MKTLKSLALIFLIQAILATIFIPRIQCRIILPNDANLIDQTCKKTPNYDVCVSSLQSDPRSNDADVRGQARILVDVINSDSTQTLNEIKKLLQGSPEPTVKEALQACADKYNAILKGDVPQAVEGLDKGNFKFAESGANDAANEADSCERGLSSKSTLTKLNTQVQDVAVVTAAVVRLLL
ncbi:Pectinesterase inhibitor-like protein [Quillaja saponaria]|uniref:Pectinesterase inhibitor-like protein n=1 Tax=Quillaja saponaria TaxID=32244 RepID=A0AAD7LBX2_QUISA|nr:Pectinesterase inhibitor-like protein [Quillaja saponaria]